MRPSLLRLAAAGATAAALASSAPAAAADAVFGGTSRGGDPIVVKADPKLAVLRSIAISWRAQCADGRGFPGAAALTPVEATPGFTPNGDELLVARNARGAFKGTQLAGRDLGDAIAAIVVDVAGKLKPGRASGTLSAKVTVTERATGATLTTCQVRQNWAATRSAGAVYGGTTSQGEPLVIRLDARRKRVSDVLMTWSAPCTPSGGYFRVPEHLVDFPLKRTGGFGNPFTDDSTLDDGSRRHWDYRISGRVTRTSAKGALQVKITDSDAAGTQTDACDTGNVTWKAVTG